MKMINITLALLLVFSLAGCQENFPNVLPNYNNTSSDNTLYNDINDHQSEYEPTLDPKYEAPDTSAILNPCVLKSFAADISSRYQIDHETSWVNSTPTAYDTDNQSFYMINISYKEFDKLYSQTYAEKYISLTSCETDAVGGCNA